MRNPITTIEKLWFQRNESLRSPHWPAVRRAHLAIEGWCRACGNTKNLEVHHIQPFHLHPELELEPTNFLTLCEVIGSDCHLHKGHLGNWKSFNPVVNTQCTFPKPL